MQWSEMSDREKDAAVAEHVIGWSERDIRYFRTRDGSYFVPSALGVQDGIPEYTTDHNAAVEVRNEIARRGVQLDFMYHLCDIANVAHDGFGGVGLYQSFGFLQSSPEQQCRAALRAIGIEA